MTKAKLDNAKLIYLITQADVGRATESTFWVMEKKMIRDKTKS